MGIKTSINVLNLLYFTLKNLPTTWGLRLSKAMRLSLNVAISEKPPHHMGIKTIRLLGVLRTLVPLKNLPTTWGLRLKYANVFVSRFQSSEKPPHHMGIKTGNNARCTRSSHGL